MQTNGKSVGGNIRHRLFQIAIIFKGIDGLIETIGGIVFICIGGRIERFVFSITGRKLIEDPDDHIARYFRHAFSHLSGGMKVLASAYLLGHGIIKLFLVVGMLRNKLWVYPIAIVALLMFIVYEVFRLIQKPSILLAVLAFLDAAVVVLVWFEYRAKRREAA